MAKHPFFDVSYMEQLQRMVEEQQRMYENSGLGQIMETARTQAEEQRRLLDTSGLGSAMEIARQVEEIDRSSLGRILAERPTFDLPSGLEDTLRILRDSHSLVAGEDLRRWATEINTGYELPRGMAETFEALKGHFAAARFDEVVQLRDFYAGQDDAIRNLLASVRESSVLSGASWDAIRGGFDGLYTAYNLLLEDPLALRLPQVTDLGLPEIGVRSHAALVDSFRDEADEHEPALTRDLAVLIPQHVVESIRRVSPRLAAKLESGLRNIGSSDPQAASNAMLAVRQVFFGLLKKLAPEDRVRPWAMAKKDPDLFRNREVGAETSYRGRILYLSRHDLDEESAYSRYLLVNAQSLVSLIGIVSKEVHDESADEPSLILPPHRVHQLLLRASSALAELIICAAAQKVIEGPSKPK